MSTSVGVISLDLDINSRLTDKLDKISSQFKKQLSAPMDEVKKEVEKSMESVNKTVTKSVGEAFEKATEKVNQSKKAISETVKEINKVSDVKVKPIKAMKYDSAEISKSVEEFANGIGTKANEKVSELTDEMRKKLGNFEFSGTATEKLQKQFENTNEKISLLQRKWQELTYYLEKEDSDEGAQKIVSQLNTVEKSLMTLQNSAEKTKEKINASLNDSAEQPAENIKSRFSEIKKVVNSVSTSVKSKLGGAFNKLKSTGGKALNGLKNQFAKLKSNVNSMNNPLTKLGKSIKSAMKSAFLMAGLYAAFRGIKSALAEACNGNEQFAKSLNEVKANLNIAFQPIMNAVMPMLNSLMSGLAKATQTIAAFTSELFGSTYQKSLETVKQVKSVAKEAEKSSKHLASFDVMNVAGSDSSSGSSSDEGGVDYSAINGEGVELPDWAERMKDAIRGGDWKGVGSLLAEKLNSALNINWNSIQNKVNNAVKGITDGLNSFIKKFDWGGLGKTFAEGINTIFGAAYTFVTTFDWSGFGTSIGNSINGFLANIDTKKMGETLSNGVKGALDLLINTIQTINWQQIGEKIADYVGAIDWSGLVSRLAEGFGNSWYCITLVGLHKRCLGQGYGVVE